MPWINPPTPEHDGLNLSFQFVKIQRDPLSPPVNAMTFPQLMSFYQSLLDQVDDDMSAAAILESLLDTLTRQDY